MSDLAEVLQVAQQCLAKWPDVPEVFRTRGLDHQNLIELGLGLDADGNGLIPIRDLDGRLISLRGRYLQPAKNKYFEVPPESGNPPWYALDVLEAWRGLLYIEGILNAMVSWLALRGKGFGIVGLGSAFGHDLELAERMSLPVWFYLDNDIVGNKSANHALAKARELGLRAKRLGSLLGDWDACNYAHLYGEGVAGQAALAGRWLQLIGE